MSKGILRAMGSKRAFDLFGNSIDRTAPRFMPSGGVFDDLTFSHYVTKGAGDGKQPPGGGTGGGTGAGGGVSGGTGAAPGSEAGIGGGTAGVGNILPWLYPTADFKNFDKGPGNGDPIGGNPSGSVALPAIGATSVILQFTVPNGRAGKITQMGIDFVISGSPATYIQGMLPAPLTFSLKTNNKPFQDYGSFQYSPGAVSAPTPINGVMLFENNVITLSVTNNTIVVTANEQWLAARIIGYYFSKNLLPKIMGMQ